MSNPDPQLVQTLWNYCNSLRDDGLSYGDYVLAKHHALDRAQKKNLKSGPFFGIELVDSVRRLCAMNLLLHAIGGDDAGPVASAGGKDGDKRDAASGDAAYNLPVVTCVHPQGKHAQAERPG